ncbi:hypothetical protein [Caballeronia sp. Sq4a]|uniref:hypothetical protein n=1 Tax=Caballeronia sp. Sq4a TaxID=2878152 RepID=UPI0020BF6526|nr:hypothetical protein [Caballeronia sp. Sq4a]
MAAKADVFPAHSRVAMEHDCTAKGRPRPTLGQSPRSDAALSGCTESLLDRITKQTSGMSASLPRCGTAIAMDPNQASNASDEHGLSAPEFSVAAITND